MPLSPSTFRAAPSLRMFARCFGASDPEPEKAEAATCADQRAL